MLVCGTFISYLKRKNGKKSHFVLAGSRYNQDFLKQYTLDVLYAQFDQLLRASEDQYFYVYMFTREFSSFDIMIDNKTAEVNIILMELLFS